MIVLGWSQFLRKSEPTANCVREGASMNLMRTYIVGLIVLTLSVSGAWGQITAVQDGRALDSNTQLGSQRINSRTPQRSSFSSQMYVTGQVSGLGAFKGETGYYAQNELRMTVPSSALSGFRRQSVGLSDVLSGNTYRTGAYFDRSTTALSLRGITAGLAAPGTNVPIQSNIGSVISRKAMNDAMSDFRPLLGKRPGNAIGANIQETIKMGPIKPRILARRGVISDPTKFQYLGAPDLSVFTVSRPSQRSEVDSELRELEQLNEDDFSRINSKRRGDNVASPAPGTENAVSPIALGGTGLASQAAVDSDVFLQLVQLLQEQHLASSGEPVEPKSTDPELKLKPLGARPDSVELVEKGLRGELVFNTLVGKGRDTFNVAMKKGEKQLAEGSFYSAADQYKLAVEVAPDNPTARLGLSVALFGAGETLGAALQLRRAMEIFPPVMVTRLKVIRKIPSEKLKGRLDTLYKRLEGRKGLNVDPQLAMLSAYMHRGAGENYIAEKCAFKLKDAAQDDKLYKAFAEFVLTGKRPSDLKTPTTKPATQTGVK